MAELPRTSGTVGQRASTAQLRCTLSSVSTLKVMELFFGIISRQAIRRGSLTSARDLIGAIRDFRRLQRPPASFTRDQDPRLNPPKANRQRDRTRDTSVARPW